MWSDTESLHFVRFPNVLNSFGVTWAVIVASVILLAVLLIRSLWVSCNDSSKPFLLMLALGMLLATISSMVLLLSRNLTTTLVNIEYMIEQIVRFASVNSLLFGGGLILLGASNTAHTGAVAGSPWRLHGAIALLSAVIGMLCLNFWSALEHLPAFVFTVLPAVGFIALMVGLIVGFCHAKKSPSTEKCATPFRSLVSFFIAPVALIMVTRVLDGFDVFQRALSRNIVGFHDRGDWLCFYDAMRAMPVFKGIGTEQWELFLPIVVALSALIFHPSVRCCRSSEKDKIAPGSEDVGKIQAPQCAMPAWTMTASPHTISQAHANMIMAPQMPVNTMNPTMMTQMGNHHTIVAFPVVTSFPVQTAPHPPLVTPIAMSPSQLIVNAQVPATLPYPQATSSGAMVATIPPLSFETTLSVLGSNIFLQLILLYYVKKMPCSDAAKPFFLVLSLGMLVGTIGSTALFVAKGTRLSEEIAYYATTVEEFGRFASLATLLFGGGCYLLSEGNAVRKGSESVSYFAWFIQFVIVVLAVLISLGGMNMLAGGWLTFLYAILPTIGFLFVAVALLIGIVRACNTNESDDEPCTKSRRLAQLFLFLATPVAMTVATRGVDGAVIVVQLVSRSSRGYFDIWDVLTSTESWMHGLGQVELFFPTAVILSALIFHPSLRSLCCRRSAEKSKVAPCDTPVVTHRPQMTIMMHPMMIPQSVHPVHAPISIAQPPQMMMIPQTPGTTVLPHASMMAPVAPPQAPFSSHLTDIYPVMHGMGGRPVYMMA